MQHSHLQLYTIRTCFFILGFLFTTGLLVVNTVCLFFPRTCFFILGSLFTTGLLVVNTVCLFFPYIFSLTALSPHLFPGINHLLPFALSPGIFIPSIPENK